MENNNTFFVDLSDERCQFVYETLKKNYKVYKISDTQKYLCGAKYVFSASKRLSSSELYLIPPASTIFCGGLLSKQDQLILAKNLKIVSFMKDEAFAYKNALLTAEGVLATIYNNGKKSLFDYNILILGAGRTASALAVLLSKLSIKFTIASFDKFELQKATLFTQNIKNLNGDKSFLGFDLIINTIPHPFVTNSIINSISQDALFIEIASVSCLDCNDTKLGFKYVLAPSLPKIYTLKSAGKLMLETIFGEN